MYRIPLLISLLLFAGCASAPLDRTELMPAPAVFEAGRIDPFADVLPEGRRLENAILYATDRDPATADDVERRYASRRGYLLRLGRAEILHGDGRLSWRGVRLLSLAKPRRMPYRLQVEAVEELGILPDSASAFTDPALLPPDRDAAATAFADAINAKLAHSRSKDIVLYVHGYRCRSRIRCWWPPSCGTSWATTASSSPIPGRPHRDCWPTSPMSRPRG
jgi:esterase/lipase superfamily enzyme